MFVDFIFHLLPWVVYPWVGFPLVLLLKQKLSIAQKHGPRQQHPKGIMAMKLRRIMTLMNDPLFTR